MLNLRNKVTPKSFPFAFVVISGFSQLFQGFWVKSAV